MSVVSAKITAAERYLSAHDPVLAPIIAAHGPCRLQPHQQYYQELVESIIGQQLSVKAAHTICQRFRLLFEGEDFPSPEAILGKSVEELRSAGLSASKAAYVQDLARHVRTNKFQFAQFASLDNEEIIRELTAVKGIGEWTAHMFLIFCMARLDVLPHGDLGIRSGIQKLYGLKSLPSPEEVKTFATAHNWHPYESVAAWYIWQSLNNTPKLN